MGKSGNPAVRAEQDADREPVEYEPTPVDAEGVEDFDAFWSEQDRTRVRVRIMGEVIELPPALPLEFELLAKKLAASSKEKDVHRLVGVLFGEQALGRWIAKGMDAEQFSVLLVWGPLRIAGKDVSLAEVAADVRAKDGAPDPT